MSEAMRADPPRQRSAVPAAGAVKRPRAPGGRGVMAFLYVWWVLILFEPEWFLTRVVGGPFYRIPQLLLPILAVILYRFGSRRAVDRPFALFMLLHVAALFYAENRGYVEGAIKTMLYIFGTCVAVNALATTPGRVVTLLKIYLLGFVWFGVQGLPNGLVWWHPLMGNEDSYGPLMVMGLGFSHNFALGTRSRAWRILGHATSLLCCVGVVSSFARGAVLSFALVLGLLWLRTQHKLRAFVASVVAACVTLVAINVLFPEGEFWKEMRTISEGTEAGTGQTRWVMWKMAFDIAARNPIFGVGAGNFGVVASQSFSYDSSRPEFADPSRLYNAALHNLYVQVFCEEGIVGLALILWMTIECFRRLKRLRAPPAVAAWRRRGGTMELRSLSLGLELGMIAFLVNAVFYNQLYIHWFWTLCGLPIALSYAARPPARSRSSRAAARAGREELGPRSAHGATS